MWFFGKHISLKDSGIFQGFTDWHSHLLPGVDDGVQTMEESMQILSLYEQLGISEVWLTPHIMEDMPSRTEELKEKFMGLVAAYQGNIALHLAAENMLDNLFEKRLERNDLLPLGENGTHLLVETSYFNPPMGLNNVLLRIKAKGYIPVLAHPERYVYMDEEDYHRLKKKNVAFQLNLPSLAGAYGTGVQKKARLLLEKGWYDLCGMDIHSKAFLETFLQSKLTRSVISKIGNILN